MAGAAGSQVEATRIAWQEHGTSTAMWLADAANLTRREAAGERSLSLAVGEPTYFLRSLAPAAPASSLVATLGTDEEGER